MASASAYDFASVYTSDLAAADCASERFLATAAGLFFSSRRRHTRFDCDWSSDVCSSDLDVFWQIADGHVFQQAFTVREGETIFDIAHDIEAEKLMTADEFLTAAQNPELIQIGRASCRERV